MITIWKYPLECTNQQDIKMPCNAEILSVDLQNNIICLWALVNDEMPARSRRILIFGTGHPITQDLSTIEFIGTVQDGRFVWHIFEG